MYSLMYFIISLHNANTNIHDSITFFLCSKQMSSAVNFDNIKFLTIESSLKIFCSGVQFEPNCNGMITKCAPFRIVSDDLLPTKMAT